MTRDWLRFGVSDGQSNWAATWKLWATASGDGLMLNLGSRFLDGRLTATCDRGDGWRVAFVRSAGVAAPGREERLGGVGEVVEHHHARRIADGCDLAFRIMTPPASVTLPHLGGRFRYVAWIPKAPPARWVEATVLIIAPRSRTPGWQAQHLYGRAPLGSLVLPGGQRVMVFYRTIEAPGDAAMLPGRRFFHTAASPAHAKYLTVACDPEGAMVVHDLAAAHPA